MAVLMQDGWAGRTETPVVIVGETPKRYRIRAADGVTVCLSRGRRLTGDATALVPKYAIKNPAPAAKEDK